MSFCKTIFSSKNIFHMNVIIEVIIHNKPLILNIICKKETGSWKKLSITVFEVLLKVVGSFMLITCRIVNF